MAKNISTNYIRKLFNKEYIPLSFNLGIYGIKYNKNEINKLKVLLYYKYQELGYISKPEEKLLYTYLLYKKLNKSFKQFFFLYKKKYIIIVFNNTIKFNQRMI
ncbi:uncharacterized protein ASCRUDRAFT_10754 [Ascoidea rubescens DSM 1968]|uniref:Uncharacterized protein n=1 Tax=Ascoidea rubescens DSM 1968 TaxID=1344418 RepID=A0A1D2V830_9ASCO|nr:hypothetical protein ASCRUDRAFT_10754 [Ascoidea rubescens DSM 1968]ODV57796.1 hypothetical protein ASCRUDRAFT_10754 [Ascoidea rubescens DSM 1968]